jgi:hypothetical protein
MDKNNIIDSLDILMSKVNIPPEITEMIRIQCEKCEHCHRKTPFLGALIKCVSWSGTYMGQRRYCSVYHPKGGDNYPDEAYERKIKTCYNCRLEFLREKTLSGISGVLYSIHTQSRDWRRITIMTITRYDYRLHEVMIEILNKYYPGEIEPYLKKYDYIAEPVKIRR